MKQCKTCGELKQETEFWYNSHTRDKLKTSCIPCCREYNKAHYEKNKKERVKQIMEYQKLRRKTDRVIKAAVSQNNKKTRP